MAEFKLSQILKSQRGQSVVEYIMLLAVISSVVFIVFKNPKFKTMFQSDAGLFATMRKGMMYSYRYGRQYINDDAEYENALNFEYNSNNHNLYLDKAGNQSRFFMGTEKYGE